MTGPDPAEKKPARSTTSRAKAAKPESATTPAIEPVPVEGAGVVAPIEPAAAETAAPVPVATAAAAPTAAAAVEASAAAPVPVAVPVASTAVAPVSVPPAAVAEPTPAVAAPEAAPGAASPSADAAAATRLSTPDIAGAVDKAVDRLRTHLTVGEIVAGLGAVIILGIAWATFGFIFGHGGTWPNDLVMLLCVAMLAALVLQNAHVHDFGPNYRVIIAGICFALGILATLDFLQEFRLLFNGRSFDIGGLTWWAGAWISVIGGLLVWREGR